MREIRGGGGVEGAGEGEGIVEEEGGRERRERRAGEEGGEEKEEEDNVAGGRRGCMWHMPVCAAFVAAGVADMPDGHYCGVTCPVAGFAVTCWCLLTAAWDTCSMREEGEGGGGG